ncbi:MAG: hypothetical protein GEU99_09320 [Luteitalea sp.]|nr:hypothetical protein [Luteitalea sp.]
MRYVACLLFFSVVIGSSAYAQTPPDSQPGMLGRIPQTIMRPWEHDVIVGVGLGGEILGSSVGEGFTFDVYDETAQVQTLQRYGSGFLFGVGGGWRIWRNALVGGTFTRVFAEARSALTAVVPHPIDFDSPRETSGRSDALDHAETAFHLSGTWMVPVRENIDVGLSLGPSFYFVSHEFVGALTPENLNEDDPPDFETVSIGSVSGQKASAWTVGYHVGLDGTYRLPWRLPAVTEVGATAFVRYATASVTLEAASGPRKVRAGGVQGGLGIRMTFDDLRFPVPWRK